MSRKGVGTPRLNPRPQKSSPSNCGSPPCPRGRMVQQSYKLSLGLSWDRAGGSAGAQPTPTLLFAAGPPSPSSRAACLGPAMGTATASRWPTKASRRPSTSPPESSISWSWARLTLQQVGHLGYRQKCWLHICSPALLVSVLLSYVLHTPPLT